MCILDNDNKYYSNKTHRVRSKNTENFIEELGHRRANYQQKRYVLMKFFHREKHIVFSDIGKGRKRMEVHNGVIAILCIR